MMNYVNVYDMNLQKTAVLQNAYNITEEQELNKIYSLSFNIPSTDEKTAFCKPFHYFRYGTGQLYRRIKKPKQNAEVSVDTIVCEHVIATLCDNVMFGSHTFGGTGIKTREVIEYILSHQTTQNWILKDCDFDFAYEYNWEQENLLNALYSVPKVFTEPYQWTFDTSVYPWRVSLKRLDVNANPSYYIRAKRNLISDSAEEDHTNICTRLYPLGYGEGINQLTIKEVNNDIPYLDAPASVIAQYGIKEKVLVAREYETAETLKAYGQTMLDAFQIPAVSRSFDVVDLYPITSQDIDRAEVGKICKLTEDGTIAYITKTTRVLDEAGNLQIDLSTKSRNVAAEIADLADRVRIESVYAQGATQLYQHSKDANATPEKGMVISLYFPSEMKQINKVLMRLKLNRFRSYSQTTDTNEQKIESTSTGGGFVQSTQGAGSGNATTTSGASSETTTSAFNFSSFEVGWYGVGRKSTEPAAGPGTHQHGFYMDHTHSIDGNRLRHSHSMPHTHEVRISWGDHTHTMQVNPHTHTIIIPAHSHKIAAGIFESGSPSAFDIYVNDEKKATVDARSYDDDITMWLLGSDGLVPRNRWIDLEIVPNDNAYVVASIFIQGFVQSRGGGNY